MRSSRLGWGAVAGLGFLVAAAILTLDVQARGRQTLSATTRASHVADAGPGRATGAPSDVPAPDATCRAPALASLGTRLIAGLADGAVFGVPAVEAAWVLYPVTQERPLPAAYVPREIVWTEAGSAPQGAQPVRRLILPDLVALFDAARADGVVLGIVSGYRSYDTQASLFDSSVRQRLSLGADRGEAEAWANRFRARPGHSQHQLGTTVDLTSPEAGNALGPRFRNSRAADWLRDRAWEFGFVVPYTEAGEARTGYVPEPWHVRWVGRELAALMMADGYLDRTEPVPDDYLVALDALLSGALTGCAGL